jgi:hypothetical protein
MVAFVDDQMAIVNDKVISLAPAHEGLDQCYVDDAGQSSFAAADNPYRGAVIFVVIGSGCAMWRLVEFRLGPCFGAFFFGHLYAPAAFSTRSIAATSDDEMRAAGLDGRWFIGVGNHEVWGDPKIEGTLNAVPYLRNLGITRENLIYKFDFRDSRFRSARWS